MYEQHFGLSKPPFRITPDPEFFFPGGNRGAVLEALVYAITRGEGIVKVVGEVGSGKTMLCRMLERELPANCEIIFLANPRLAAAEILHAIAFELGLDVAADAPKLKALHALHDYLLARHAENRRVIMFVEEAQGMPLDSLEEIRMLSNLETTREKLLQIVLFGQPELDEKLNLHEIRQLRERITHAFDLAPFKREQVRDYVTARVRASGYRGEELFSAAAIRELEFYSEGLLRRINVLADKALLAAFASHDSHITPAHVAMAARDSEFSRARRRRWPSAWLAAGALALAVALGMMLWMLNQPRENLPATGAAAPAAAPAAAQAGPSAKLEEGPQNAATDTAPAASIAAQLPAVAEDLVDNQPLLPALSPSGLVTSAHLRPRLEPDAPVPRMAAGDDPAQRP